MRVSANFKMILASAAALAIVTAGSSARAQDGLASGVQAQSGPRLDFPAGLATDGRAIYVANSRNNTIEAIDPASKSLRIVAGTLFQQGSNDGDRRQRLFDSIHYHATTLRALRARHINRRQGVSGCASTTTVI